DAQREKLLGAVSTARPVPLRVFTIMAAALGIAIVAFVFWGEYTRRERVEGILATNEGAARVLAGNAAVVERLYVKEGAEVTRGPPIVKLVMSEVGRIPREQLEAQRKGIDSEIAAAKPIAHQEEEAARARIASINSELQVATGEVDLQTARVELAQHELERAGELAKKGFFSEADVRKRRNDLIEQKSRLQAALRQRAGLERDLAVARNDLAAVQLKLAEKLAQLDRKKNELNSATKVEDTQRSTEIPAPTD